MSAAEALAARVLMKAPRAKRERLSGCEDFVLNHNWFVGDPTVRNWQRCAVCSATRFGTRRLRL